MNWLVFQQIILGFPVMLKYTDIPNTVNTENVNNYAIYTQIFLSLPYSCN